MQGSRVSRLCAKHPLDVTCHTGYNGPAVAVMAKEQNVNQTQAIAKLKKIIGPTFGYRVDPKAPDADERERRHSAWLAAKKAVGEAEEAMTARRLALMAADAEYQRLKAESADAKKRLGEVGSFRAKRITVGRVGSMFFSVVADGDSWAEVVEKAAKQ